VVWGIVFQRVINVGDKRLPNAHEKKENKMRETLNVENIKCAGCAKTIENGLLKIENVTQVFIEIEDGIVTVEGDNLSKMDLAAHLLKLGYPEKGSVEGLQSVKAKATSFVSCAIGRMDKS